MTHTVSPLSRFMSGTLIALTVIACVHRPASAASLTKIANDSTGAIAAVAISCNKDRIIQGVSSLFGGLKGTTTIGGSSTNSVPITVSNDSNEAKKTAASTASTTNKLNCWNLVEKAAAQVILKELTLATINWINHGLDNGDPLFPKDTGSFLKSIGDQEVKRFVNVIGFDSKNYPFGRMVAQSLIGNLSSTFEQRSRYSLNEVIGHQYPGMTSADFQRDFGYGGWDAFLAQSFTNNNPYGFAMEAQDIIGSRIGDTAYSPAQDIKDQLASSGGFLSTRKCVDPRNYDPNASTAEMDAANAANARAADRLAKDPNNQALREALAQADQASAEATANYYKIAHCNRSEVQTPGSVISSTLNKALSTPFDQLALGQDLTSSLTAIFDTLVNHFMQKGLTYLSSTGSSSGSEVKYTNNSSFVPNVSVDNRGSASLEGSWYEQQDGTFNVFTDIPNLIYNECNNLDSDPTNPCYYLGAEHNDPKLPEGYQQVLQKQINFASLLIPAIHQLDYCVPGPHPTWREDSLATLQAFEGDSNELPINSDAAISQGAKIIHQITDPGNMFKEQGKEWTADKRNEKMYSGIIGIALSWKKEGTTDATGTGSLTSGTAFSSGYFTSPDLDPKGIVEIQNNFKVNGYDAVVNIFDKLFSRYAKAIDTEFTFNKDFTYDMAGHISQNQREYRNLPIYQQAIEDNYKLLEGSKGTVTQLQNLVKRIAELPTLDGYADTHPTDPSGTASIHNTTQNTVASAESSTALNTPYPPKVPDTHHYYQDLQAALAIKNIALLSDYQVELKRISNTFSLIAPAIHSQDDLTAEESGLNSIKDVYYSYTIVPNGYIDLCIKDVKDKKYIGPNTRMSFPAELDVYLRNTQESPNMVAPGLPADLTDTLKPDMSFLPNYFYGMGQKNASTGDNQLGFFQTKYGIDQTQEPYKSRVIQNDDIVTINSQPIPNALRGFEQFINTY